MKVALSILLLLVVAQAQTGKKETQQRGISGLSKRSQQPLNHQYQENIKDLTAQAICVSAKPARVCCAS